MNEQGYYEPYEAFKELYHTNEVNAHIKDGSWVLLKIGEITTSESLAGGVSTNTRLVYIVGLKKKPVGNPAPTDNQRGPPSAGSPATASSATHSQQVKAPSVSDILNLPWVDSDYAGVDKWVPADKVPAAIAEHFRKTGEKTAKGSFKLAVGNFEVYLSPKGHLQRYLPKSAT